MSAPAKKKAKLSIEVEQEDVKTDRWKELNLSEETIKGIQEMGFSAPTAIQAKVIPIVLEKGLDVLGAAETGSGKTMAFAIPIFEKWLRQMRDSKEEKALNSLFALVITPTRELAMQIHNEIKRLTKFAAQPGLRSVALVGGLSQQKQERLLKSKPQVIVATPGRFWSIMDLGGEHLDDLSGMKVLVVDEIDRMLEKGHFEELDKIVQRINCFGEDDGLRIKDHLQTLIFSATLTFTHEQIQRADGSKTNAQTPAMKIRKLMEAMCLRKKHQTVDLTKTSSTPQSLIECRMNCADLQQKDTNLYYLLNRYKGRTLVFANSIDATQRLYGLLRKLQFQPPPMMLHAKMKEQKRLKNFEKFATLDNAVLLATDVAARGLDIKNVDVVIHYQVPKTTEGYVHRSGRTARAFKSGRSVLLVDPSDVQLCNRICKNLKKSSGLDSLEIDSIKLFEACGHRVFLAAKSESTEFRLKKASSRKEWFKKAAEEMDIILDEKLVEDDDHEEANPELVNLRRQRKKLESALAATLKRPLPFSHLNKKEVPEILKRIG